MIGLLLQTKLFKPTPRPSLIARPQLIDRINDGLGLGPQGFSARLTLVSAPAGFGKTTLVAAWLAQTPTASPYLSTAKTACLALDEHDNDPVSFLTYLAAALQTAAPEIGQTAMRGLSSPESLPPEVVLATLINDASRSSQPIILVLSDYHLISAPPVHQALAYLLDHLPPQLHLLLTTRSDPPLPLSRLRGRSQLAEIRTGDLRFTPDEIGAFFSQAAGLALSSAEIAALERRTEGWVTGLQLAALSLKGHENQSELIAAFTGSHRFVIDYLTEEVLARQPEAVRDFLLATSILDRICAPLADALTGSATGQETLAYLEDSNLFLTPLDDERRWYRYHHLFAGVLQARLRQSSPDTLTELHRRAGEWHARSGMMAEAVRHLLACGDVGQAASLIEEVAGRMIRQGASATLARWLDALPEETVRARPRLCLARGWMHVWGPVLNPERAEEWVRRALQSAGAGPSSDSSLEGEIAALQGMSVAMGRGSVESIAKSRQALAYLPAGSPWLTVLNFCLGTSYYGTGDLQAAHDVLAELLDLSEVDSVQYVKLIAGSLLADILAIQGFLSEASDLCRQVLAWADGGLPQKGVAMAHGGLAAIHYERDELESTLVHLQLGAAQLSQVGGFWPSLAIYLPEARLRQAQGEWPAALAALERAAEAARSAHKGRVATRVAALRACVQLAQGNRAAAEAWAAGCKLSAEDPEPSPPALRGVGHRARARVLSAQGRHAEALALLEQSLESARAVGRQGSVLAILALQAVVLQAQGNAGRALACLERALALGQPEGYCRTFVDEGRPMADLLRQARQQGLFTGYVDRLLGAFRNGEAGQAVGHLLPEPLSERELEVLRLVATGASNKQIAGALFIALPTVKKHMGHILVKLDTHNRVQAIARARELGLIG